MVGLDSIPFSSSVNLVTDVEAFKGTLSFFPFRSSSFRCLYLINRGGP